MEVLIKITGKPGATIAVKEDATGVKVMLYRDSESKMLWYTREARIREIKEIKK